MSQIKRVMMLCLENDLIGDGWYALEVAQTLREFADSIECYRAGRRTCELFVSSRGTRVTTIAGMFEGEPKPTAGPPEPIFPSQRVAGE